MGWEVVVDVGTYCPVTIKPLGVTSTRCLYCYAMLVDVVWVSEIHDRCENVN